MLHRAISTEVVKIVSMKILKKGNYRGSLPYATFGTGKNIWLMRVWAKLYHYCDLAYAFFGLFYFIGAIFGPKIAQKTQA